MTIRKNGHQTARYAALRRWGCIPRVYARKPTPSLLRAVVGSDGQGGDAA